MKILDVDLLGFESGDASRRRAVVDGVMRSLATGFVYVEHDLPESELDECYARLGDFFRLPSEMKNRIHAPGARGQRGYTPLLVETAAGGSRADWKEMLNWGEAAPPGHPLGREYPDRYAEPIFPEAELPGISQLLMKFHRRLAELQCRFLRIVAEGLGARPDYFDPVVRHGATLTRAIHYPPMSSAPAVSSRAPVSAAPRATGEVESGAIVWAAEHGDINLVTALPRATAPGLQVKTVEGWTHVEPPEGSAVLNTGMMLEHVSNGVLPTGRHRVVAQPGQVGSRLSVVQFCHPTPSTILTPLESCVDPTRPPRFHPIRAAEWLDEVLREIGLDAAKD